MTCISDFKEAWWTLTQEEKERLQKAYDSLEKEEGDITDVQEALSHYIDNHGWESDSSSAFEDFLEIIEN